MRADQRLKQVGLFASLDDDDLARICEGVEERALAAGEILFREGDAGDTAYVIAAGDMEILKSTGQRETLLALRRSGDVIGELALLQEQPRSATARARTDVELLTIPRSVLGAVLANSPAAMRSLVQTLTDRLQESNDRLRQSERMAQLGTLSAGIAHELNNPAAAARGAAERLGTALDDLVGSLDGAAALGGDGLAAVLRAAAGDGTVPTDPLERSDAEASVEQWLDDRDVPDAWRVAGDLVSGGVAVAELDGMSGVLAAPADVAAAVALLARLVVARRLAREIAEGVGRVSEIVSRMKSHAYLDRAQISDVDVHRGLDDTLMLLAHNLKGITVVRDYDPQLPHINASGGELNQVWTNLLDNASYELRRAGVGDPTVTVRTHRSDDDVVVEVEDNGPGLPDEVRDRVFDAFFTTKPPGEGTGQGLNISYQIVVLDHRGELTVDSEPGRTIFRVVLPIEQPAA